jgi:hypothetical protein
MKAIADRYGIPSFEFTNISLPSTPPPGKYSSKGIPAEHRRAVTQDREAAAAPYLGGIAPALRWHFTDAGWNVLIFEHVSGRAAGYAPGSPDLVQVTAIMRDLSGIRPDPAPGLFRTGADRWASYVDHPEAISAFTGPFLTHADWTPDRARSSGRSRARPCRRQEGRPGLAPPGQESGHGHRSVARADLSLMIG